MLRSVKLFCDIVSTAEAVGAFNARSRGLGFDTTLPLMDPRFPDLAGIARRRFREICDSANQNGLKGDCRAMKAALPVEGRTMEVDFFAYALWTDAPALMAALTRAAEGVLSDGVGVSSGAAQGLPNGHAHNPLQRGGCIGACYFASATRPLALSASGKILCIRSFAAEGLFPDEQGYRIARNVETALTRDGLRRTAALPTLQANRAVQRIPPVEPKLRHSGSPCMSREGEGTPMAHKVLVRAEEERRSALARFEQFDAALSAVGISAAERP